MAQNPLRTFQLSLQITNPTKGKAVGHTAMKTSSAER